MSLRLAIGLVDMSTRWTRPARVARIDKAHRHTRKYCLVADKRLQLCEGPRLQYRALLPRSPHPRLDMCQLFQRYPTLRAFGNQYQSFRDHMVDMSGKAGLLPCQLAKAAARAMRTLALEFATQPTMAIPDCFDYLAAMGRAVAINRDIRDTHIDTEHPFNINRLRRLHVADRQKVEHITNVGQICFTVPSLEQGPLALTTRERDRLPAIKRPDRHGWRFEGPTQDAVIVGDAPGWTEGALAFAIQLVAIGNLTDTPHDHLRGKTERLPSVGIGQLVELKLSEGLSIPGGCADAVTRGVGPFKRAHQGVGLFRRWQEFQLGDQLHLYIILKVCDTYRYDNRNETPKRALPLLGLKPRSFQG